MTAIIITAIIAFILIKPVQNVTLRTVEYVDKLVAINTAEDFVDFDRRANIVAEQLNELGPVRVEDLPKLFKQRNQKLS